jgi:hypothetical protein
MADAHHELGRLAKLVLALAALLILAGVVWYGITAENFQRIGRNVIDRPNGPLSFRFILQPSMAAAFAIRDGVRDARVGRHPFFWTILWSPAERGGRLREGLNSTARIILLGLIMDAIYQVLALKTFHPNEAVIVALLLAFMPYLIIRGIVTRVVGKSRSRRSAATNH